MKHIYAFVLLLMTCAIALNAQNGGLDIAFNGTGIVTTALSPNFNVANSSAVQPDGKIIVAGFASNGSDYDFAIARYNSSGSLDNTFNGTGKIILAIGSGYDEARGVAIQTDGKIVVAGYSSNGSNSDFTVVRFNSNGTLDNSFGGDGIVTTDINSDSDEAYGVAIQSNGKILVVGYSINGSNSDFAVVRYNSDGSLDVTFDGDGIVTTAIGSGSDEAKSIAIQSDGKIVVAGYSYNGTDGDVAVVRYNSNGILDNTFGASGIVVTDIDAKYEEAYAIALQSDGKIVVAGYTDTESNAYDAFLLRYTTSGVLDNTFDGDGKVITTLSSFDDPIRSIAIQSDGKIIAAGSTTVGSDQVIALHRYNSNGSLDNTFGTNGIVTTSVNQDGNDANSVVIQSNGKIVVAGYTTNSGNTDVVLVRYNGNVGPGDFDITLNGTGKVMTTIGSGSSGIRSVALQSDGKIVAAGHGWNGANENFAIARYTSTGTLDNTFNTNGKVMTSVGAGPNEANGAAIQADGKIVAVGYSWSGMNNDFAVVRYNSNGSLDNSFGGDGIVTTNINSQNNAAYGVAIQPDGKIIVVGYSNSGSGYDFAVVRYNSNGSLDNSFGGDGIVTTDVVTYDDDEAKSIVIQPDGKIVVGGYAYNGFNGDAAIVRYNRDGTLDTSFDDDGMAVLDIAGEYEEVFGIALQSDGKILATGYTSNGNNYDIFVLRYSAAGLLDDSFDTDGKVITSLNSYYDVGQSIAVQSDGKVIVAGYSYNGNDEEIALLRYLSTGTLDNSFGANGVILMGYHSGQHDYAAALVIQPDSAIVVAGRGSDGSNDNFSIFRFIGDAGPLVSLLYSHSSFAESFSSPGAIDNSAPVTIMISGDTFTGSNNDNFVSAGKVTVSNLPSGLTAVVTRTSATTVSITLIGNASAHGTANNVSNLTVTFQNSAFTGGNASGVVNYEKNNLQISFADPEPGNALRFDGADDYVQVPYSANLNPAIFTYEIWARVDGGEDSYRAPMSSRNYDGISTVSGVHFYAAANNNKWEGWIGKGASGWSNITGPDVVEGEWTHLAQTYDGTTQRFYVNGVLQGSAEVPFLQNANKPLRFGSISDGLNYYFNGNIDEARIWNVARTEQQIRENMHRTINPATTNLVGYWQFNKATGTTASESHGYNGILNNFNFNGGSGWVTSTIPAGPGSSASTPTFTSGTATLGDVSITTTDAFDNAVDLAATALSAIPNALPGSYSEVVGNKYYIVNAFGTPGTFSANLTINFGADFLDSRVNTNPGGIVLYKRNSNSEGAWALVGGASSANSSTGNVTWSGITSFSQFTAVYEESALPVELASFAASVKNNFVELKWRTETEVNNAGFSVERMKDELGNMKWEKIGFVEGSGTTNSPREYSFTEKNLAIGKFVYRLKQMDRDGKFNYSKEIEVEVGTVPKEFALDQNYPNPFNPTTTISYTLSPNPSPLGRGEGVRVTLKIYDALGKEVATLVNEEKMPGRYEVQWNAESFASGIYFARLTSLGKTQIRKLVLMK